MLMMNFRISAETCGKWTKFFRISPKVIRTARFKHLDRNCRFRTQQFSERQKGKKDIEFNTVAVPRFLVFHVCAAGNTHHGTVNICSRQMFHRLSVAGCLVRKREFFEFQAAPVSCVGRVEFLSRLNPRARRDA